MALAPEVWVRADSTEIRDLLVNLVLNAIDAMPTGGVVTLATGTEGDRAFAIVRDTGIGMDDDVRRQCFDLFFSTKGAHGTGLGLSMSLATARRLGGEILVDSRPGAGSESKLLLPICPAPPPSTGAAEPVVDAVSDVNAAFGDATPRCVTECATERVADAPQVSARRVLLVDDQPSLLELTSRLLGLLGHKVVVADSSERALRAFRPGEFDVLMTDLDIPDADGLQLADRLKQLDPELRVVLLTGWGRDLSHFHGRLHLADWILAKPVTSQQLSELLAAVPRRAGNPRLPVTGEADPFVLRRVLPAGV